MVHIGGANTVRKMLEQLAIVKESKGKLGVLATRRTLFQMTAESGFNMDEHIEITKITRTSPYGLQGPRRRFRHDSHHIITGELGQLYISIFRLPQVLEQILLVIILSRRGTISGNQPTLPHELIDPVWKRPTLVGTVQRTFSRCDLTSSK